MIFVVLLVFWFLGLNTTAKLRIFFHLTKFFAQKNDF